MKNKGIRNVPLSYIFNGTLRCSWSEEAAGVHEGVHVVHEGVVDELDNQVITLAPLANSDNNLSDKQRIGDEFYGDDSSPEVQRTDADQPEVQRTDADQPEVQRTDADQPEVQRTDAVQSEVYISDEVQSEVQRTDADPPEVQRTDTDLPEVQRTDTVQPEVQRTDTDQPEVQRTDTDQPEVQRTKADQPEAHRTDVDQPEPQRRDANLHPEQIQRLDEDHWTDGAPIQPTDADQRTDVDEPRRESFEDILDQELGGLELEHQDPKPDKQDNQLLCPDKHNHSPVVDKVSEAIQSVFGDKSFVDQEQELSLEQSLVDVQVLDPSLGAHKLVDFGESDPCGPYATLVEPGSSPREESSPGGEHYQEVPQSPDVAVATLGKKTLKFL